MFNLPSKVVIEKNGINQLPMLCKSIGSNGIVICDSNLKHIGKKITEITKCEILFPESSEKKYIKKIAENVQKFDFIIGVGGGRTIDIAKYTAFLSKKPWISFPTILSHDGVVSNRAAITNNSAKISLEAKGPEGIVVDTEIIKKAPYRYIAAGAADVISNISSVEDWKLGAERGEQFSTIVAELALIASKAVIKHIDEIKNRTEHGLYVLSWSLICSGLAMNIYGSSRPASGSEHNFSHALEKLNSPLIHGEQCALGTIIMLYLQNKNWKRIKNIFRRLNIPTSIEEFRERGIKIDETLLIKALVLAKTIRGYERYTILDRYEINEEFAKRILKDVGII